MQITVCTLYTPNIESFAKITTANKRDYCIKRGYGFIYADKSLDISRPPAWSKILLLLKHIKECDWLVWLDADSLIMNYAIKLEELINNRYLFVTGSDWQGINTGFFAVKNNPESHRILNAVYSKKEFINHIWFDQAAFRDIHDGPDSKCRDKTLILPQKTVNSYVTDFKRGDFILHLAAESLASRHNKVKEYIPLVIK